MTLANINRRIKRDISKHIELVKGEGYHYFVFDNGKEFETESEMVPYTYMHTWQEWLSLAKTFSNKYSETQK